MNLGNRLKNERSPYLLQHKDNPVWWQPWSESIFEIAKKENKPIFLSIGYSTCHWCHVMAHESFEDNLVATILNEHFISIKVDREERPDIDDIYMTAVQHMTGRGGWPMSVWLTPDRKPFFAGSYFPKDYFVTLLKKISQAWNESKELIEADSDNFYQSLQPASRSLPIQVNQEVFEEFIASHKRIYDARFGGFGNAPKFPQAINLLTLLNLAKHFTSPLQQSENNSEIFAWINNTLKHMCRGGIYDQLNGGFHRYSTDEKFMVPHFEKMLYDNALLSIIYLKAYQQFHDEDYKMIAQETLSFITQSMLSPEGVFYSAIDADSFTANKQTKVEGYYYTFSEDEIKKTLSENELHYFLQSYALFPFLETNQSESESESEKKNIIFRKDNVNSSLDVEAIKTIKKKLRTCQLSHEFPHVDKKILVAWNSLTIIAFALAGSLFKQDEYLDIAKKSAQFILKNMWINNTLYHQYCDGLGLQKAFSDDYSCLISACIFLYEFTNDELWLKSAIELHKVHQNLFWDDINGGYYRDDGSDKTLISRLKDNYDTVIPSSNSLSALNLVKLYRHTLDNSYLLIAEKIFSSFSFQLDQQPMTLSLMVMALHEYLQEKKEFPRCTDNYCSIKT